MCISNKINSIIQARQAHLPRITAQREQLVKILSQLDKLDALSGIINNELGQKQGDYYSILVENPKSEAAFRKVNTGIVRDLIKEQMKRLEILEKRFGRDTVCIAMIGYERQGKSTFLQAISGLENEVIPAYSGTSCTGAVSVIHNIDGPFRTEIEMYSEQEFLDIVREKLRKFFPDRNYVLNSVNDLKSINLDGFSGNFKLNAEFNKFKDAYCDHVDVYAPLLGQGLVSLTNPDVVIQYVAQYQEWTTHPGGDDIYTEEKNNHTIVYKRNYYRYLAVKHVDIYKQFNLIDCRQIQLVDTIGLGDTTNAEAIEKEMFRVLREDCDAAVDIYRPEPVGGLKDEQTKILDKIASELRDRDPSKWIVYVINKVMNGEFVNFANIPAIKEVVDRNLSNTTPRPVAWCEVIQGNSVEEVRDLLVNPLLDLISANLGVLDANLMQEADNNGQQLYAAYFKLTSDVEAVLSKISCSGGSEGKLFDKLFAEQTNILAKQLRILDDEQYGARRSKPCAQIAECLNSTIDTLYDAIPDVKVIEEKVDVGNKASSEIFGDSCDELCNNIYKAFENVSTDVIVPLREDVKKDLASALYHEGSMGNIPLKNYRVADGASVEWLKCLIAERVNPDAYPLLHDALNYIISYHFNIEDTIEYDVAQSIGIIDKMNTNEFIQLPVAPTGTVSERADAIWQELCNRISPIQIKLRVCRDRFALIPSHSFATRVQKFRVKVVFDEKVKAEIRDFYHDNSYTIWRDKFAKIDGQQQAFGQWNEIVQGISALCEKNVFELNH